MITVFWNVLSCATCPLQVLDIETLLVHRFLWFRTHTVSPAMIKQHEHLAGLSS